MTTDNTSETIQIYRVYIKATPQAIWRAVTDPSGRCSTAMPPGGVRATVGRGLPGIRERRHESARLSGRHQRWRGHRIQPPRKLVQTWRMTMTLSWPPRRLPGSPMTSSPFERRHQAHRHSRRDGCAIVGRRAAR